ncbi:helix-turn-helix transcriptional regulator [Mucilaginibacter sp. OK098]|uniref:helix-turn-helix transcriptional regulator n=1 Tax=Mucilaginibacter sp. OK098 TaxID=1855297 RepID=UPI00091C924D|nr:helix-turn-helix transcriptional regulator [Mucilaginibacter sp. OK098]SHL90777.1 AraC-type DNA-binding protein [Mucilaginibacter sp. OK098]
MKYAEYKPGLQLAPYIDAYYTLETGALYQPVTRRIFADGCTEIFINLGESKPVVNNYTILYPGNIYLGGTMTASNLLNSVPNSRFLGIRFKPSGFSVFYNLPLDEIVDEIIEFPDKELYALAELDRQVVTRLDQFFSGRLKNRKYETIIPITQTIEKFQGLISVDNVAQTHHVTIRTLERIFSKNIGIPPKEFISIIRFQHAAKKLQRDTSGNNLLRIATDMGYYDHSHLTREIKKYSGLNPSELTGKMAQLPPAQ